MDYFVLLCRPVVWFFYFLSPHTSTSSAMYQLDDQLLTIVLIPCIRLQRTGRLKSHLLIVWHCSCSDDRNDIWFEAFVVYGPGNCRFWGTQGTMFHQNSMQSKGALAQKRRTTILEWSWLSFGKYDYISRNQQAPNFKLVILKRPEGWNLCFDGNTDIFSKLVINMLWWSLT